MKKLIIIFYIFIAAGIFAQDLIIFKDGNIIEAKVIEISPAEIKYKRFNHLDGPTIVIPADTVLSIRYENGMTDIISAITQPLVETTAIQPEIAQPIIETPNVQTAAAPSLNETETSQPVETQPLAETSAIVETPDKTVDTTESQVPATASIPVIQPLITPERIPFLNTLGISLGYLGVSNFGFSINGTVSPGPYIFFDFSLGLGFWDFSFYGNVNFNGFVPFNRGGWYGGLGLGGGIYEVDGSYNGFFSINAVTGLIFFDWLNISATLQMELVPEFNLRFKPMLGYIYRFTPPIDSAKTSSQYDTAYSVQPVQSVTLLQQRPAPVPLPDNFVRVYSGTFTMGSPLSEFGRLSREGPQRQVTLSSFYMAKYEVTQKEFQEIMGANPSKFIGDDLPVERVSWYDAIEYCNRKSIKEGLKPAYIINDIEGNISVTWNRNANGYRLPTEAEWEYACRAGTITAYNTGKTINTNLINYRGENGISMTNNAGSYDPNTWDLYDMHGNVWEWCWDWYGKYPKAAENDPTGADSGSGRVLRGGSWASIRENSRSAYRVRRNPLHRNDQIGFRVVISPQPYIEHSALVQPPQLPQSSIIDPQQAYDREDHFWSLGIFMGTSFTAPLVVGSISTTISPFRNSF